MPDDRTLSLSAVSAPIPLPIENIDIGDWLFRLPDSEYQRCAHAHLAAGTTTTDDGHPMSINVEIIGDAFVVQHYVAEVRDPRYEGPRNIEAFLTFLHDKMYPGFKFVDVNIYIDTPDQAFGEYTIRQKSGISGKQVHQRFFGHCVAANDKIVLLREALNVLAAADGMFPGGEADLLKKK